MFYILILFFVGIAVCYFLAKAIRKYVPEKFMPFISLILYGLVIFLAFITYQSVMKPIHFNKEKVVRYSKVIKSLKMIRDAQAAHRTVIGTYAPTGDDLIKFIDTAKFAITEAHNEVREIDLGGGITGEEEYRVIDTVGFTDVRASFVGRDYKNIMDVPGTDEKFIMTLGKIQKAHGYMAQVFEVKVSKDIVLAGMDVDLLRQEKEWQTDDQVKGTDVRVGSLADVSDNGNWPPSYDQIDAINKKE